MVVGGNAASTRETPDFAHLLELAAKPAEERAQRQSGPVKGPAADFYQAADFLMVRFFSLESGVWRCMVCRMLSLITCECSLPFIAGATCPQLRTCAVVADAADYRSGG